MKHNENFFTLTEMCEREFHDNRNAVVLHLDINSTHSSFMCPGAMTMTGTVPSAVQSALNTSIGESFRSSGSANHCTHAGGEIEALVWHYHLNMLITVHMPRMCVFMEAVITHTHAHRGGSEHQGEHVGSNCTGSQLESTLRRLTVTRT